MRSNFRILFITHYSSMYGANRSLLNLLEGFRKLNIHPMVVVPENGEICQILKDRNIPYVIQPFGWWCSIKTKTENRKNSYFRSWISKWKKKIKDDRITESNLISLKHKIGDFKPTWVYSNSSVFNFGFLFAQRLKIPHLWHLREVHEHFGFNWLHSLKRIKKHFKKSEIVIAISDYVKDNFEKKDLVENAIVVYDGVLSKRGLEILDRKNEMRKSNSSLTFGIVGILHSNKGQEEAIRAFAIVSLSYPSSKLIVVGLGNRNKLKELAHKHGVSERIEFWGHLTNPFDAFLSMDVLLMCSRMEGLGRVTIEAMASNIPIIGYMEGGTIELIEEQVNGLFYKNGYEELAEKMIYMIKNEEQRLRMGNNGRKIFEKKYTSEICAEKFFRIINQYKKLIS